jgi:hypothetical protein
MYDNSKSRRIQKNHNGRLQCEGRKKGCFRSTIGKESLHEESNYDGVILVNLKISKEMVISRT